MSAQIIPAGPRKGTPLTEASDDDIKYWLDVKSAKLADEPNHRFADQDQQWCEDAEAELNRRGSGGQAAPANGKPAQSAARQQQTPRQQQAPRTHQQQRSAPASGSMALAKSEPATLSMERAIHDPVAVTDRLRKLAEEFHVVTPATRVDAIPPGCGIAVSYVYVDKNPDPYNGPKEVYKVGDRLGLSGDTLKRIAAAAAIDWDARQSGRLDDGSDPRYVHFRAVGYVRNFDGSLRTLTGEVEIDARDGSPLIEEIVTKAKDRQSKPNYKGKKDGGASQILELRKFLLRHAESKAKNRAIADMGVKRSYAPAELDKPFAVARLMWTGETDDPVLREKFALMHAERMMDGVSGLYGRSPHQPMLPAPRQVAPPTLPEFHGHPPPPVSATRVGADELGDYDGDAEGEEIPPSGPQQSELPQQSAQPSAQQAQKTSKGKPGQQSLIGNQNDEADDLKT